MTRSYLPLNSLRAFEAAARHLSFTHAAIELNVTHSAISQHVKALEQHLNCQLFVRVSRGLMLTTEGENLLPVLNDSFDRIAGMLDRFASQRAQEKLKIGGGYLCYRGVILAARGLSSLLSAYRSSAFDA
jgi:LysR family transcriptional regulator of beta-lactamase